MTNALITAALLAAFALPTYASVSRDGQRQRDSVATRIVKLLKRLVGPNGDELVIPHP